MRVPVFALSLTVLAGTVSHAQTMSSLTGFQVLSAIANARGVSLDSSIGTAMLYHPASYLKTPEAPVLAEQLRVTPEVFSALVNSAGIPVTTLLATQAVMQAQTGRALLLAEIALLIKNNPQLAVINIATFRAIISDPVILARINAIILEARKPVTARGGRR